MNEQIIPAPDTLPPEAITSVVSLYDWAGKVEKFTSDNSTFHEWVPVHAGKYLEPVLTGYMTAPVGFHYGKPMEAKTITTTDLTAFRNQCATWIAEGKQVFLYMAIWYPSQHVFFKADPVTFEPVECDPPVLLKVNGRSVTHCWRLNMFALIKNFAKKITGITAIENATAQAVAERAVAQKLANQAIEAAAEAKELEQRAKETPKERATAMGEPYVAVLDTHVNSENVRNGFFELDWNDLFIVQLKQAGYGFDGDPDEEIVDRWFRDLARNMLAESGQDPERNNSMGYINVTKLGNNRAQVE